MQQDELVSAFTKALNRHGFGFQQAIIQRVHTLDLAGLSPWAFECAEFPVQVHGRPTHIDLILTQRSGQRHFHMIAECKRAHPSFKNWCFAKARRERRTQVYPQQKLYVEHASKPIGGASFQTSCKRVVGYPAEVYRVGLEIKKKESGSNEPKSTNAINDGITQVLRGLNGYVNYWAERSMELLPHPWEICLLPVLFTTATIHVTRCDLSSADLATGDIEIEPKDLREEPFILYEYNASPDLKHDARITGSSVEPHKALEIEYTRTIAIVSPSGIDQFLSQFLEDWVEDILG